MGNLRGLPPKILERMKGQNFVPVFTNGAGGNIVPIFVHTTFQRAQQLGSIIAG